MELRSSSIQCVHFRETTSDRGETSHEDICQHNKALYTDDLSILGRNTIRVLEIYPGAFSSPICCHLKTVTLDKTLKYDALSYAWGARSAWQSIAINDMEDFVVTDNLFAAIRRVRKPKQIQCIWIDAICINQAHIAERNAQVDMMGRIFFMAQLVYIWLGPCISGGVTSGQSEMCLHGMPPRAGEYPITASYQFRAALNALCNNKRAGLNKLQWWWRTWAVQEVVLSGELLVLIGPHELFWREALTALIEHLDRVQENQSASWAVVRTQFKCMDDIRRGMQYVSRLETALRFTRFHAASDSRDKVYGLLGLAAAYGENDSGLRADYNKSYEEVCADATGYLTRAGAGANLNALFETGWKKCYPYPSWAFDFNAGQVGKESMFEQLRRLPAAFPVRRISGPWKRPQILGQQLHVTGIKVGKIVAVAHNSPKNGQYRPLRTLEGAQLSVYGGFGFTQARSLQGFNTFLKGSELLSVDTAQIELESAEWTIQWLEGLRTTSQRNSSLTSGKWYDRIDSQAQLLHTITASSLTPQRCSRTQMEVGSYFNKATWAQSSSFTPFHKAVQSLLMGRTFFIMSNEMCGVAAPGARPDDIVAVVYGLGMPVVLRPSQVKGEYTWVGECFVAGIMNGELVKAYDEGKAVADEFTII